MILSQRMQFFIFFVVVAIVYSISHHDMIMIFGDDVNRFHYNKYHTFIRWIEPHPERIWDNFYSSLIFSFYYKFIYLYMLKPLFGDKHFVDVFVQFGQIIWGLVFAGFALISICYVRLFVKLNIWLMAIYALLFYFFFAKYDNAPWYLNRLFAYDLTFLVGVCFLYPFIHYIIKKQDPFENWNETHAITFMAILTYLAYFTILFTVVFISIVLLCLLALYIWTSYQRSNFKSVKAFWKKAKNEPKWLLCCAVLSPILLLIHVALISTSSRFKIEMKGVDLYSFEERLNSVINYYYHEYWEKSLGYDIEQILFFIIILALALMLALIPKWKSKQWKISSKAKQYAICFSAALVLFIIFFNLISIIGQKPYIDVSTIVLRFVFITLILGLGFKLLQHKTIAPAIYFVFFFFSMSSIKDIASISVGKTNAPLMNNIVKEAASIGYTFNCYGEKKIPYYSKLYVKRKNFTWSSWQKGLKEYMQTQKNIRTWGIKTNIPEHRFIFYYEPSIDKINAKLAELQKTKIWQCKRVKNDIYRIEQIDY